MDTSQSEESLSSIINEEIKDLSFSTKGSETENLDAIKKFIEEQEKEIQENELQEKELQEKKLKEKELKEKELQENIFQEKALQEKELQENKLQEKEFKNTENIKESIENVDTNKEGDFTLPSSVMNMILNDSESKISEKVAEENAKDASKPSLEGNEKSDQKVTSPSEKGNASMPLSVGSKVEAKDFGGDWHAAEVAEVDLDENEVLVRYEMDLKKHDEWISVSSPRLRPFTGNTKKPELTVKDGSESPNEKTSDSNETALPKEKVLAPKEIKEELKEDIVKIEEKPKLAFEVGERCLARWRDNRRFVATIQKDLGDGKFEIIFDDGFHWTCTLARLHKMKADALTIDTSFQSASAGSPSPMDVAGPSTSNAPISPSSVPPYHTHLFDPSRDYLGSKSERREKKRKLNIKEIFNIGQKKTKIPKAEKEKTPSAAVEKKPRVRRNVAPKAPLPKVVVKKEIKTEIPDAVASIIGTVTKEVKIKLEPISKIYENQEATQPVEPKDEVVTQASDTEDIKEETDDMTIDDIEPMGCVVNPDDATLDDEEMEEPKSEGDSVLDEEMKLENFEEQDTEKHEEVIDKIKEAIIKLEGGISMIEESKSPKLERVCTPIKEIEIPEDVTTPELKQEVKSEDLKDVLAEVASSIDVGGSNSNTDEKESTRIQILKKRSKVPKSKRDPSKVKKSKKLRILNHKLSVNRQVEKVKNELEEMKRQFEAMRKQMLVQEYVQSQEHAPLPESYLRAGEWCCRWVNGQPVGKVSEVEGAAHLALDNRPALPRRSVEVDDKRLPPGWTKHMVRRSVGHSAGKWDVVLVSPEEYGNKKFHVKSEMRNFLENYPDASLKPYEHALLDFGVHLKIARRMNWVVNTPDGITEAPETILAADTVCNLSPLVKRKSLNVKKNIIKEKKRGLMMKDKTKRRPIKLKLQKGLHTYNSQLVTGESSGEIQVDPGDLMYEPPMMPLEDGYVYVGSLKVQIIDTLLRCPAEGCFKNFRTKTLLQMHIKHYHRELTAQMGATPKVLDLAYARTKPNTVDAPQPDRRIIKVKINKPPKREEQKILMSDSEMSTDGMPTPPKMEDTAPVLPRIPRSLDSPKLRRALIHKPVKRPRVLLPVRRLEPERAVPDSMYEDEDFDNQITEPLIDIPMLEHPLDFETAISTHTVTKPAEKKKKSDRKKTFASFSKNISEDEEWFAMNSDELDTRSSFPRSGSPDSKMDVKMAPMSSESNDDLKDAHLYTYTETGERIKIVQMKREEIINCHCGMREEDGLMVQCELCLCWQHALCYNIQRECDVPAKYTCSICLNPRRGRRSRRFLHDQDRLYEGLLPGAKPCESLRRAHELAGNLIRIDDALHALRVKLYVASKKDHPKLYLWAKDWEPGESTDTDTQEKVNCNYSDLNIMINGMDKENHPVKQEDDGAGVRTPPSEDQDSDRLSQRDNQIGSQSLLSGLLSSPGGASIDLPISTSELERLAKSVQESAEWARTPAPQPEAAIENGACREHLLNHIQRCQTVIDARLDSIEAQVVELESEDPSFGEHYETAEYYPRIKQTIQMLMRDLDTMEELGVIT